MLQTFSLGPMLSFYLTLVHMNNASLEPPCKPPCRFHLLSSKHLWSLGWWHGLTTTMSTHIVHYILDRYKINEELLLWIRATSHTSQELWPQNCEPPKENVQRPSQHTSRIMHCGHGPSRVMWRHMWPIPQPDAILINFYSCRPSHIIK